MFRRGSKPLSKRQISPLQTCIVPCGAGDWAAESLQQTCRKPRDLLTVSDAAGLEVGAPLSRAPKSHKTIRHWAWREGQRHGVRLSGRQRRGARHRKGVGGLRKRRPHACIETGCRPGPESAVILRPARDPVLIRSRSAADRWEKAQTKAWESRRRLWESDPHL